MSSLVADEGVSRVMNLMTHHRVRHIVVLRGGELLDDAELHARNERAFARMEVEKQRAIERRQLELEAEQFQAEQNFSATQLWR